MPEYRDELNKVSKEVPNTVWTIFKWSLFVVAAIAILVFIAQSLGLISINIQREITQHSQQYVETKVNLLNKLHSDWLQLAVEIIEMKASKGNEEIIAAKVAQQKSIVQRMKTEVDMIPSSQVPNNVQIFLSTY